jgi:hypothetical protein
MKKAILYGLLGIICLLGGCKRNSQTQQAATSSTPTVARTTAPAPNASAPQSPVEPAQEGKLNPDVVRALTYINQHFIPSPGDNLSTWVDQIALSADAVSGDRLVHTYNGEQRTAQGEPLTPFHDETATRIADLDINSISTNIAMAEGFVFIGCKEKASCVSWNEDGKVNKSESITLGSFAGGYVEEVAGNLKRILQLEQGEAASEIKHQPTEEEILAFIQAHIERAAYLGGGITISNRSLSVEGDELIETGDIFKNGERPGHLGIRANLKALHGSVLVDGSDLGLTCEASSTGNPVNCITDDAGDASWNTMIRSVSNGQEVAKMLERLILLHR